MRTEFVGRQEELAWLRSQFDACATRGPDGQYGGPRMAFVIAESGIGKSRLVQELYLQLTSDPQWDPPEVDYWPDAFKASGEELHVVPDMKGHVAKGPPRFAWLGARWHPTDERNVQARKSILPELRSSLTVHAEILRAHQSIWQDATGRIVGAARHEGIGEVIGQLADSALPFGGLLLKIASGIKDIAVERRVGPESYEEVSQKAVLSDADEVLDCFRLLLNAKSSVPAVLWLDDAQWIDADTLLFVKRLWAEATRRRWPLFVVVTHWEREWRELATAGDNDSLHQYNGVAWVSEWRLDSPPDATLAECLKSRLPGLSEQQASLMIEKAAGNFLQLLENIGEMVGEPMNFTDERLDGPLTEEAVARLRDFKCDRKDRVRQRFQKFESDVKKVLGWSSQFGQRFLSEVVESFAKERLVRDTAGELIDRCVDPYVVLDRSSHFTREFRDKVFHKVADEYRHQYLLKDADQLSAVLRSHLVEWLTHSVTPGGELVFALSEPDEPPKRCLAELPTEERRDFLGIALQELPLPESPDWTTAEHRAGLWAICWAIDTDSRDVLWKRVGSHFDRLHGVSWNHEPLNVYGLGLLDRLLVASLTTGRLRAAKGIAERSLAITRQLLSEEETPERLRDVSVSLNRVGDIEKARGQYDEALTRYEESLAITRQLLSEEETPERLRDVCVSLIGVGDIEQARGQYDEALARYEESLAITRQLLSEEETPQRLRDVCVSLSGVGDIEKARGQYDEALARYEESLAIDRQLLSEEETPERLHNVSISLNSIGDIKKVLGQYDEALARYEESLAIAQRLSEDGHRRDAIKTAVWSIHLIAETLGLKSDHSTAYGRTSQFASFAEHLEVAAADDANCLDTCAAFWESRAAAAESVREAAVAAEASQKAAALRRRIADMKDTVVVTGRGSPLKRTLANPAMSSRQHPPPACEDDASQQSESMLLEKFQTMRYPSRIEFEAVLEQPSRVFDSADLRSALPERDCVGLPRARCGAFGTVYKMISPDSEPFAIKVWAMHCADREERYRKISDYLTRRVPLRCLVPFEYRRDALWVLVDDHAARFPVLKQDWVAGEDLNSWTRTRCLGNEGERILRVAEKWRHTAAELETNAVAHGDIEPGNILITDSDDIKLVDYDSMCVPSLACRRNLDPQEIGTEPYVHPQRDANTVLSRDIDNFSFLFIFLTLRALAAQPQLWVEFVENRDSDKLLIETCDLEDPEQSALCKALRNSPDQEVRSLLDKLIFFYRCDMNEVPSLSSIVSHEERRSDVPMAHDVFISHSSKDKTVADATCACLESRGLRCWIAPRDILAGAEWGASIIAGIKGAKAMVLILSSHSNISPQVLREIERAVNRGVPVLPLRIEDVVLSDSLEYFLSSSHWLDAYHGELRQHLEKLANNVAVVIEKQDAVRPLVDSDPPTAVGTNGDVLREGQCKTCGTVTGDLTKKYCRNPQCGASLRVPCLKCDAQIPVWDGVCGECGWNRIRLATGGNAADAASRRHKKLFIFLLDQSWSMQDPLAHGSISKVHELVTAVNACLHDLCVSCATPTGFEDSCDVAIIRYGTDEDAKPIIESALIGPLASKELVTIREIADNPARLEQCITLMQDEKTGELVEIPLRVPVWIDPLTSGATPICSAICKACEIIDEWIPQHEQSCPPIVINITDGESSEGDPIPYADALKQRGTDNGNVLFFNCCLSSGPADPLLFKGNGARMPDDFARSLYQMSSPLPESIVERARREGQDCEPNARGMAYNVDKAALTKFLRFVMRL